MTISEYYNKFITLLKFAHEVVATKELKAQRFEQGLTEEIHLGLGGETFSSLQIVYGRASPIYGLQSRHDEKNVVVGEKRKDFNAGGNQGCWTLVLIMTKKQRNKLSSELMNYLSVWCLRYQCKELGEYEVNEEVKRGFQRLSKEVSMLILEQALDQE